MAITFVGTGTFAAGDSLIADPAVIDWPAHQTDDVGIIIAESANQALAFTKGSAFAQINSSPQSTGVAGSATSTRLTAFWARATSNAMPSSLLFCTGGDHVIGRMIVFRGVKNVGYPIPDDGIGGTVEAGAVAGAGTSANFPDVLTTVDGCMIVNAISLSLDVLSTAVFSAWTSKGLVSITEAIDNGSDLNNGGCIGAAYGIQTVQGSVGITTATTASSATRAMITLALEPAPPPASAKGHYYRQLARMRG